MAVHDLVYDPVFLRQWDDSFEVLSEGALAPLMVPNGLVSCEVQDICWESANSLTLALPDVGLAGILLWDGWARVVHAFSAEFLDERNW